MDVVSKEKLDDPEVTDGEKLREQTAVFVSSLSMIKTKISTMKSFVEKMTEPAPAKASSAAGSDGK